jgi:hypothetical protein
MLRLAFSCVSLEGIARCLGGWTQVGLACWRRTFISPGEAACDSSGLKIVGADLAETVVREEE